MRDFPDFGNTFDVVPDSYGPGDYEPPAGAVIMDEVDLDLSIHRSTPDFETFDHEVPTGLDDILLRRGIEPDPVKPIRVAKPALPDYGLSGVPVSPKPVRYGTTEQMPRFVWADEFCALPPNEVWTIRDYLEPDALCVLYGDSETFKSFLAVDLCAHIATGKDWRGKKVNPGIALYVAGEGGNGLRKRVRAWFERHKEPIRNIAISTVPLTLCEPGNAAALVADIKALLVGKPNPSIIVLDTLNTHFGGDENSTSEMTKFLAAIRELRIATGALILVIHHCGHGAKDRGRGSISLRNGIDWEYRMDRTPESLTTTLTCTKSKDADKPPVLSWNLEKQPLPWVDNDGVPMASCVLVPTEAVESQPKPEYLPRAQRIGLDALRTALMDRGTEADGVVSVAEDQWRDVAYAAGITDSEKPDTRKRAFHRCKDELVTAGKVSTHEGRFWIPRVSKSRQSKADEGIF